MNRHTRPALLSKRTKILVATAAGLVLAGSLASAPFVANAAAEQSAAQQLTASLGQANALDGDHLGVYAHLAEAKAEAQAQTALDSADAVIAAAVSKVDAGELQVQVGKLADYRQLSVDAIIALTNDVRASTQKTQDAITAYDAAAQVAAAAAEAARVANTPDGARAQARELAASQYGWGDDQFQCLDRLWTKESNWRVEAGNTSSGATGIPQSLPGEKMASVGADWATSARTQIIWGLGYIAGSYGTPCAAWGHSQSMNWY